MQHRSGFARRTRTAGVVAGVGLVAAALTIVSAPTASALPAPSVNNHGAEAVADAFGGMVAAADGGTYQVGYQVVAGTNRALLITKSNADGSLDTTFGTNGRSVIDLVSTFHASLTSNPGAKELARAVAVDRLGRLLVLGEVEGVQSEAETAADTDIFVARVHPNGRLDTSYGQGGWSRISLSDGVNPTGGAPVPDAAGYTIAVRDNQRAVFTVGFGTDSEGTRTSRDIGMAQLRANGTLDPSFGNAGTVAFPTGFGVNVRNGYLDADGSWFATGYANVGSNNQPFIAKVTSDGTPDTTWGDDGLATLYPGGNGGFAEAYGLAATPDGNYVVSGYGYRGGRTGPAANNGVDAILFSLKPDGTLNRDWAENGFTSYHFGPDGNGSGDRHRNHVVLPDGRIVGVGGSQGAQDAILTVTAADGTSGEMITIDLGATDDHLWGLTTVGNGYQVVASGVGNSDSKLVTIDLTPTATSTTLTLGADKAAFGAANTATVTLAAGGEAHAGNVELTVDGKPLPAVEVSSTGTATVALPRNLTVGSHQIEAKLAATSGVAASQATATLVVTKAASSTTVRLAKAKVTAKQRGKATITVNGKGVPSGTPLTGTVTVLDGKKKIAVRNLTASGRLTLTLPRLSKGKHTITVRYAGNASLSGSSTTTTLKVTK